MKLADIDWSVIRGGIIFLLVTLLIGGVLLGGSYYFWSKMDQQFVRSRAQLLQVRGEYTAIDEEVKLIEVYLPRYQELEEKGIVGREQRVNWVEALKETANALKLPSLEFAIDLQKEYRPDFAVPTTSTFKLYSSTMSLKLGLLHEGDLPRVLYKLNKDAVGLYSVSDCVLARSAKQFTDPSQANVTAKCDLRWMTIDKAEQPGASG